MSADKSIFTNSVSSLSGWLFYTTLFAALILLCSEIGRLLGLPGTGLKISVFWPAAGVALSALLLFGFRLLPGIFAGALVYNAIHLIPISNGIISGLAISSIFSLSSTLQAALAAYILLRFASVDFFNRFQDTLIFLLPAGLLACVVASAISIGTLILIGYLPFSEGFYVWLTFWIGDTAGVFVMTPLILGFAIPNPMECTARTFLEAALLFILLSGASLAIFIGVYPLAYLLLPFMLWAAFRFNIQGASICMTLVSAIAIITTHLGRGPFSQFSTYESLFFLVIFINSVSASTLILIAILNERKKNAHLLHEYNLNLESMVHQRTKQLHITQEELQSKERLASLGVLISGISYEIRHPLSYIRDLARTGEDCISQIKHSMRTQAAALPELTKQLLEAHISTTEECLQQIRQNEEQAHKIVERIIQQSRRDNQTLMKFQPVHLHEILDNCCASAVRTSEPPPPYTVKFIKDYDRRIDIIEAVEDDLYRVVSHLLENSLYALHQKMEEQPRDFTPTLTLKTKNFDNTVEIAIKDNGIGMSDAILRKVFQPFFSTKLLDEGTGLGLALTYDIVVQEHHGTIVATSQKGIFTEIVITLPKMRNKQSNT